MALIKILTMAYLHYAEGSSDSDGVCHQTIILIIRSTATNTLVIINKILQTFQNLAVSIAYSAVNETVVNE